MKSLLYLLVTTAGCLIASNADASANRSPRNVPEVFYPVDNNQPLRFEPDSRGNVNHIENDVSLSDFLWKSTTMYQKQALNSVFVQGIKNSNLGPEGFGAYNIQDAVYCYHAKVDMDIAANNASSDPFVQQFLQNRSASYEKYYEELFQTWQVKDPAGILLNKACSDYINHEHNVAMTYDPVYFVMALIPCAKLWPWIGQQLKVSETATFGVYTDWARANFNPDDSGVAKYENLINDADRAGKVDRKTALAVYAGSMKGEAEFFNSVKGV